MKRFKIEYVADAYFLSGQGYRVAERAWLGGWNTLFRNNCRASCEEFLKSYCRGPTYYDRKGVKL